MDELRQLLQDPRAINALTILGELLGILILFAVLARVLRWAIDPLAESAFGKRFGSVIDGIRRNLKVLLVLAWLLASVAVAGVNGYLVSRGEYLPTYTIEKLRSIPREFWIQLGIGLGKVVGLVIVTAMVLRVARRPLAYLCERAKSFEGIKANDASLDLLFERVERSMTRAAWLGTLLAAAVLLQFPAAVGVALWLALKVYLLFSAGVICWRALDSVITSLDELSRTYVEDKGLIGYYNELKVLIPVLQRTIEYVIFVSTATLIARQVEGIAAFAAWGPRLLKVLGILFVSRVVVEVAQLLIQEFLITRAKLTPDQRNRRQTIVPLLQSGFKYVIYFGALILVLKAVGIDPLPILAGAGVVGIAVGLGAQSLVNDLVSGFFILFENYYLVGDYIRTSEAEGVVEAIDIRSTRIRDGHGRLHIIRNGRVEDVVNFSKGFALAVVEVGVAYESDLARVYEVLAEIGVALAEDLGDVLSPTRVDGVEAFGASEVVIRTTTKVKPGQHLGVQRELRLRIKNVFDEKGISIPYTRQVISFEPPLQSALQPALA